MVSAMEKNEAAEWNRVILQGEGGHFSLTWGSLERPQGKGI